MLPIGRRGVRTTKTTPVRIADSRHSSNVKPTSAASAVTALQIPKQVNNPHDRDAEALGGSRTRSLIIAPVVVVVIRVAVIRIGITAIKSIISEPASESSVAESS